MRDDQTLADKLRKDHRQKLARDILGRGDRIKPDRTLAVVISQVLERADRVASFLRQHLKRREPAALPNVNCGS